MIRVSLTVKPILLAFASVAVCAILPNRQTDNGVAIPLVKHPSSLNGDKSVSFDVLRAHVEYVVAKIARSLDNYENNMESRHPSGVTRKRAGASVPLEIHGERLGWYGSIKVGTPPESFKVVLDTGSSDLVLPAAACGASCEGHTLWDPAKTRPQPLEKPCEIRYFQGSVNGDQYTDNVTIAGFTAKTQTLCAATKYPPQLNIDEFIPDGIMGLGFPSLSQYGADPVFETLVKENSVTNKVFSLYLDSKGGELYIGGANPGQYQNDFVDVSVNTDVGLWKVTVQNIQSKGRPIPGLQDITAVIDTGASFIIGDKSRVQKLHRALGGFHHDDGYYIYSCENFPDVSLTFNGKSFPISASTHNIGKVFPDDPDTTECWSGIVGSDFQASKFWVIGAVFLQNVYTSFDYGNKQIRFSQVCSKKAGSNRCTIL